MGADGGSSRVSGLERSSSAFSTRFAPLRSLGLTRGPAFAREPFRFLDQDGRRQQGSTLQQLGHAVPCSAEMGNRLLNPQAAELLGVRLRCLVGVDLVDGEEERLAGAQEQAREVDVGRGELGAAIDDHDDDLRFFERDPGLAEDFGGDELRIVRDDAAGIDDAEVTARPLGFAVDAVAGDARLVADDGAAAPVRRLKSVDLPTLGRPQMATVGTAGSAAAAGIVDSLSSFSTLNCDDEKTQIGYRRCRGRP